MLGSTRSAEVGPKRRSPRLARRAGRSYERCRTRKQIALAQRPVSKLRRLCGDLLGHKQLCWIGVPLIMQNRKHHCPTILEINRGDLLGLRIVNICVTIVNTQREEQVVGVEALEEEISEFLVDHEEVEKYCKEDYCFH